jgi:uncharacterized membrane protein
MRATPTFSAAAPARPKASGWLWLLGFFAVGVGLYPFAYFWVDRRFGLLSTKTAALLADQLWNVAFYAHIVPGGVALLIGWAQFHRGLQASRPVWHRRVGWAYAALVLMSGLAGLYLAAHATGGWVSVLGFGSLALIWLYSTGQGVAQARAGQFAAHQRWMVYSYAACLAAVALRLWLPLLVLAWGSFMPAYRLVAWLCWVPNLVVAYWLNRRART